MGSFLFFKQCSVVIWLLHQASGEAAGLFCLWFFIVDLCRLQIGAGCCKLCSIQSPWNWLEACCVRRRLRCSLKRADVFVVTLSHQKGLGVLSSIEFLWVNKMQHPEGMFCVLNNCWGCCVGRCKQTWKSDVCFSSLDSSGETSESSFFSKDV